MANNTQYIINRDRSSRARDAIVLDTWDQDYFYVVSLDTKLEIIVVVGHVSVLYR